MSDKHNPHKSNQFRSKTFPLRVTEDWLESIGKALRQTGHDSKHDFIIEAVNEKMDEVLGKKDK